MLSRHNLWWRSNILLKLIKVDFRSRLIINKNIKIRLDLLASLFDILTINILTEYNTAMLLLAWITLDQLRIRIANPYLKQVLTIWVLQHLCLLLPIFIHIVVGAHAFLVLLFWSVNVWDEMGETRGGLGVHHVILREFGLWRLHYLQLWLRRIHAILVQVTHGPKLVMQTSLALKAFWQILINAPTVLLLPIIVAFLE